MNRSAANKAMLDIVIIGGGIAGLWTLARLQRSGYQAILLEADKLAGVQSGASQGIIHGGTKYALTGKLTHSSQAIQQMPQRWKDCLSGQGEVDLRGAKKLSAHQYLWSNKNLAAKITGFFASKVMRSRVQHLHSQDFVPPFNQSGFNGDLYRLDEPVLDIQSVAEAIRKQYAEFIFHSRVSRVVETQTSDNSYSYQLQLEGQTHELTARQLIFCAGAGNEALLKSLNFTRPEMQRRPLFMPMLKAAPGVLPRMYAHCLGAGALPKMTITSHALAAANGPQTVWYLGGEIAEQGVGRSIDEQVKAAREELHKLMPWMDFSTGQWSALAIDRAEPKMPDGSRPVEPAVFREHGVITAWPVKLAMAPVMADKVLLALEQNQPPNHQPFKFINHTISELIARAETSPLPWEKVQNWQ